MPSAPRGKKAKQRLYKPKEESFYPSDSTSDIIRLVIENGPGTVSIAITLIVVYLITAILSGDLFITNTDVVRSLVHDNQKIMDGELWRLITSIFLHGSIFHLGGNLLFLLIFGWRFEELAGTKLLVAAFIITGIGGNLLTLSLVLISSGQFLSLGASGAVQGLLGASITLMYFEKKYSTGGLAFLSILVIFFVITVGANTNFFAHLGGLITGIMFSALIYKFKLTKS